MGRGKREVRMERKQGTGGGRGGHEAQSHTGAEYRALSQVWRAEEASGAGDLGIFQPHSLLPFKA